ncbi:putative phage abortive infection protein [Janthinobacterium lividum]|uniref:putative phage abortive infection protein n=1 Tax=Janthinobacterium lividum TaxID=29581 RepID=UPI0015953BF5|nr:putative phage abortive infection protein [Janthinobacterium lividum]QKY12150.1 hypothetical protein G8765_30235 [Janthinobacterium lividum]
MVDKIQQLLTSIEELDFLEKNPLSPQAQYIADEQIFSLKKTITEALGSAGHDALTGSRAIMKKSQSSLEESQLKAVRLKLIAHFLNRNDRPQPKQSSASHSPPLRKRMRQQVEQLNAMPPTPLSWKDRVTSDFVIMGLYAIGFIAWVVAALWMYGYYTNNNATTPGLSALLWGGGMLLAYCWLTWGMGSSVSLSLKTLIDPGKRAGQKKSAIFTKYIAVAFMIGLTLILALLFFDYAAHSEAAEAGDRKAKAIAAQLMTDNSIWRLQPAVQSQANIESTFKADFGSFAGTFGDFFGGVLNPILTFGTLLALAITILMQRSQLIDERSHAEESSKVSNIQAFETTFFNLLNLHNETVKELVLGAHTVQLPIEAKKIAYKRKAGEIPIVPSIHGEATGRSVFAMIIWLIYELQKKANIGSVMEMHIKEPLDIYKMIQQDHNNILGHYFRNLYQALSFVDRYATSLESSDENVEHQARKRYTNILRAQLSSHELSTLFYNCLDNVVDSGAFRSLLIEYAFLEHLSLEYIYSTHELHVKGYDFPITQKASQYLGEHDSKSELAGAFGENPQVAEYLLIQQFYQDIPLTQI